jgi:hypothetical protein
MQRGHAAFEERAPRIGRGFTVCILAFKQLLKEAWLEFQFIYACILFKYAPST